MTNPNFDKDEYKYYKKMAREDNVRFLVLDRAVIAYSKTINMPDCRMIQVAVAWCAPEDTFKRKVGKYQALLKMYSGQVVQVPLGWEFDNDCFYVEDILTDMFGW